MWNIQIECNSFTEYLAHTPLKITGNKKFPLGNMKSYELVKNSKSTLNKHTSSNSAYPPYAKEYILCS